ncbi:MAG: NAD-dependent epimerase/dehydratase [Parcubacteria group bacterium GW2011_GWA2_47_26]|nr:MAG: NAD-dependent epimerase/dehydratase [Parcubacteria group bacterium GW2011_GWA2_47_26]
MKILIVGGAGYLGGALTDILMQSPHEILVYDLLLYEESYRKQIPFVRGDVRDYEKLQKHLDWADAVVWLAALVGDPACALNEELTFDVNKRSLEYLKDHFRGRIIFMSSCSVYGASESVLTEISALNPLSLYAKTKLWGEEILAAHPGALIFRLGTLFGVSDTFSRVRFDLVVNTLAMRAALHKKISVFGGAQYRPLLHVRDAAATVAHVLDKTQTGIYNLHSENVTILQIAERIKAYFTDVEVEITSDKFQDDRDYRVSSDKAKVELGFDPKLTVDDGIRELKQLLEEGRIKDSFTTRFSNYLYLRPLLSEYESPLGRVIKHNL